MVWGTHISGNLSIASSNQNMASWGIHGNPRTKYNGMTLSSWEHHLQMEDVPLPRLIIRGYVLIKAWSLDKSLYQYHM
jgi:hypothetical protein